FMRLALREAERALEHDDVPIGAVVVRNGEVLASGHNERELRQDPTAHAEIIALREAARAVGSWRVLDTVIYVTLEPCAMCAGAIVLARVPRVVYGAYDPKAGACGMSSASRASTIAPPWPAACSARSAPRCSAPSSPRGASAGAAGVLAPIHGGAGFAARGGHLALGPSPWRGGRAVECGGLEIRVGAKAHLPGLAQALGFG